MKGVKPRHKDLVEIAQLKKRPNNVCRLVVPHSLHLDPVEKFEHVRHQRIV
jgi:hypothetical protein